MKVRMVKGLAVVLCAAMLAPAAGAAGAVMMPGMVVEAAPELSEEEELIKARKDAIAELNAYKISLRPSASQMEKIDEVLVNAYKKIGYDASEKDDDAYKGTDEAYKTSQELMAYVSIVKADMDRIINPPSNGDDGDDEDEDPIPVSADHLLMVGGNWVTPVASAGQMVSIVLPVVNMGKTMVNDAVVTPVLSTDTTAWPFEITNSNYSQTIEDLPGTDTGMTDMDRRREVTWNLKTRSDVGNGYQKISFKVVYRDSEGRSQETTLDTYVQLNGTAGVGADGQASVPRVIVTGFETEPADVHAGESFMLTLHLKNTSTATSVNNMIFEIVAAVEGKDEDTTYAAFLPTAGSSTIFVDSIGKNGTKDIQIEMEAKADLTQKPYAVDVNMSYEDEHVNAYTNKTSVSIPVKQEARVDISEPEVMPSSIEVGSESNIMFNIYNMGKTKLYNVQVKTDSETVNGGDAFIGNLDSGATGAVDIYVTGQSATTDEGLIKLLISYEDETGASTVIEKEVSLFVNEAMMEDFVGGDDMMTDDPMMDGGMAGGSGKYTVPIVIGVIVLAGIIGTVFFLKRKKKKEQQSLEEDILDLDDDDTQL
ncbi:MAG: hypothetical protein HFI14_00435 [Lachnospiraceae bacterium]|nr:hypothetical protein [Lachnospiraceae bacterium]